MKGVCKLCLKEEVLKESHFIPKFIGKWLKNTSATGYLRATDDIDKRVQDLAKEYWMCGACEGLLSEWERQFANKLFFPYQENPSGRFNYSDWLAKFCASLSWRTMSYMRSLNAADPVVANNAVALDAAEVVLKGFVLGSHTTLGQYEQHLVPLDAATGAPLEGASKRINRYFLRSVHMDIVASERSILIYTKLPSFILLGVVRCPYVKQMRSSRVALGSGAIMPRSLNLPIGIWDYINEKADKSGQQYSEMSDAQQKKISDFIEKNPDRVANSRTMRAFIHDMDMFGSEVFSQDEK